MTSKELDKQLTQRIKNDIWAAIERLSELKANYNCFDENEAPYYHALSIAIEALRGKISLLENRLDTVNNRYNT